MLANKIMAAKRMDNVICHSLIFCISAVTAPIQLLGLLEMGFQNAANQAGFARENHSR